MNLVMDNDQNRTTILEKCLNKTTSVSSAVDFATTERPGNLRDLETLKTQQDKPKPGEYADCEQINRSPIGPIGSGVYTIYPRSASGNNAPLRVFCRVEAGRAWTVIQRRQDGSVDFFHRTWHDYSRGFGNLTGEFWLGNDNIHLLTNQGRYKLYIAFEKFDGNLSYSEYACFRVENEQAKFKLHMGPHNGTSAPYVWVQRGSEFKIKPCVLSRPGLRHSCYQYKVGGFWVWRCDTLNPNGFYWKKAEDCPKHSRYKKRGILGSKFIEMRISESDDTSLSEQGYDNYCKYPNNIH
ncbi:fibrinogen-like protein 1 [Branchiostoma lanceolatum]|uniref:fibrinogen-like protein 1 n=1 Tax=Branchiostoma lanceolatum TaxID=7740 RepID=UPI0034558BBF